MNVICADPQIRPWLQIVQIDKNLRKKQENTAFQYEFVKFVYDLLDHTDAQQLQKTIRNCRSWAQFRQCRPWSSISSMIIWLVQIHIWKYSCSIQVRQILPWSFGSHRCTATPENHKQVLLFGPISLMSSMIIQIVWIHNPSGGAPPPHPPRRRGLHVQVHKTLFFRNPTYVQVGPISSMSSMIIQIHKNLRKP